NNITNAADNNRPVNAIYSLGTSGKPNTGNTISNNNIYDFLKHASASRGLLLADNTTAWTIDGNSFYETAPFIPAGTVTYTIIDISNVSGNGFIISNNYIGGSAPQCGGNAWTKTNNNRNLFNAISLEVGTTLATSVQNNTIQNFNWSQSGIATWVGINVIEGSVDIGTLTGNTVGATTGTNSISVTGGSNGQYIYAVKLDGTGVLNCNNNSIGSITGFTASTYATYVYGIGLSGSAVTTINNNTIGSTTTAKSIFASSESTESLQNVYGIYTQSTGTTTIHENIISNLRNNTSNSAVGTKGLINAIYLSAGTNTIDNNTIRDISIANANTSTYTPSIAGIHLNTITEAQSIHDNLIYNISNTSPSFTGCVVGIFTQNSLGASAGSINANFIHSLSVDAATVGAKVYGIYENTDGIVYSNNIITLDGSTSTEMYGIYDVGNFGKTGSFFFNSVYISGSNSGSENSYALRYNTNSNTRDLRNNILFNARTGGTGGHYAIYYDATGGSYTAENNDYYVTGVGGILGYHGGDKNTLALLQSATGQDANSISIDPEYTTPGGTSSDHYITSAIMTAVAGTGIITDYDEISRANPPKMGALEFTQSYVWQGNISSDFATASNWENGDVPPNGADISFAASPANDCYLDQNRTLNNITNASSKKLVLNAKQLTLTGNVVSATANQIEATSTSSLMVFAGVAEQSISSGVFVSNTIDGLALNNSYGLTQMGDLMVSSAFTLTNGEYTVGANTLTLNGAISTTSGSFSGGSTSDLIVGGSGSSTTLPGISVNNLTLNRDNGMSLGGDLTVAGTLALTSGTLTMGANTLTLAGTSPTRVNGNIDPSHTSSLLVFANPSPVTCPESLFNNSLNNVSINGGGISACCSCTINGILNLESANPSSTQGTLHMGSDTLNMGLNATTVGIGDVTGIVKREHAFIANTTYSFGSQYTTVNFSDANAKPSWICIKLSMDTIPGWTSWTPDGKVKRLYQMACSDNASTAATSINMRYLLSEMDATYNDESLLAFWHKSTSYGDGDVHENGKSNQDFTHHFIGLTDLLFGTWATEDLDDSQLAIAYSLATKNTWKGEVDGHQTEWEQTQNWTYGRVPLAAVDVLIPSGLSYFPSLTASSNAVAKTIEIQTGASISANAYTIAVSGAGGAWINNGTFNAGTGKVLFDHGVSVEVVTVAGTTDFYDIEVAANTTMQPITGSVLRIAGAGSADITSNVDFSAVNSTVEWNGANQTIVNPNGIGGNSGYYKLILSGSGTKTMPTTAITIADEFQLIGPVT
ncbi:MAG: hypothetical protein PF444_09705, partial [Bacteroidales bacterium]|nr:hypothetical protein [Bacteroidales bacterium]